VAHDQQIGWFGANLKELAGAVEERGARGGKQDIAPMGREHIGLTLTTRCRTQQRPQHYRFRPKPLTTLSD
jgi:hypothetical protein